MATCHLVIGATWHDYYSGTVTGATVGPPVNGGKPLTDHQSTVAVNGGQWRWSTTVNGGGPPSTTEGPPPDHRSTVVERQSTGGSTDATWTNPTQGNAKNRTRDPEVRTS
ncbi:hypothetical protein Tco_1480027, partial [Tanacetum coccineum]